MYIMLWKYYCLSPATSKNPKQLPNCQKRAETNVVLIFFDSVLCETCTYTVAQHELGTRKTIFWSVTLSL